MAIVAKNFFKLILRMHTDYVELANSTIAKDNPYVAVVSTEAPKGSYEVLDTIIDAPSAVIVPTENLSLLTPAIIVDLE